MTVPVVAFFNNKGGVGKTSLVYHLAWMYADLGLRVIAADLDPQANLTSAFLDEGRLEQLWPDGPHTNTIFGCFLTLKTTFQICGRAVLTVILALFASYLRSGASCKKQQRFRGPISF